MPAWVGSPSKRARKRRAEGAHAVRIERQLARRQHAHAFERIERALRVRIEAADGLDQIIEQIDAQRRAAPIGKTSNSEPRSANSPGLVTWPTLA